MWRVWCGALAAGAAAAADVDPVVEIAGLGAVRGVRKMVEGQAVDVYRGIRYATAGRFEEPVEDDAPWAGVLDKTKPGTTCPGSMCGWSVFEESEDCLKIDVYKSGNASAPFQTGGGLPVMVWIHGGGYIDGCSTKHEMDTWVSHAGGSVVAVGVEYRLAAFGFLGGERLRSAATNSTGNWGLLDQAMALAWIKKHIASFGGDPERVTIYGQSAGAGSVMCHIASPRSAGLFHGAVMQSGLGADWSVNHLEAAERALEATLLTSLCRDVACLKRLTKDEFELVSYAVTAELLRPGHSFAFAPTVDGVVLPRAPLDAFRVGTFNNVPILTGTNRDEAGGFVWFLPLVGDFIFDVAVAPFVPSAAALPTVKEMYTNGSYSYPARRGVYTDLWWAGVDAITDASFTCGNKRAVRDLVAHNATVYPYFFNHTVKAATMQSPPDGSHSVMVEHGAEMAFTFDCPQYPDYLSCAWPADRQDEARLADDMVGFWVNFARTGAPGGAWGPPQPVGQDVVFAIDTAEEYGGLGYRRVHNLRADVCAFWDSQVPPH